MNATRRIAAKDFGHQVKIETNDEFEELGASFNEMAARLEIHLEIVTTLNRIGIALTAERDTERLTELILLGAKRITNADGCSLYTISDDKRLQLSLMKIDSLSLVRQGSDGIWIPLYDEGRPNERNVAAYCALNDTTINIPGNHTAEGFDLAGSLPIDLEEDYRVKSFLSIPMKNHEQEVIGVLQLINARDTRTLKTVPFSEEDKHLAEILAAQAGVALMKNKLLDDYKRLFESVTELLATAIDEMSPHTGGHCRRVPDITMMLAEAVCNKREGAFKDVMMTEEELYELKVAALLHDCGKVTTPVHIVDKTTKLQTIFDRMHIIEARFEILRRDAEIAMLQRELALRGGNGEEVISALRAETESLLEELAGDRDFLRSCNIGGESMEQAHLDRLKAVAQKYRVLNTRGEMETILSEEELGMLSIRYGNLTSEERRVINQHVETGERLLRTIQFPRYLENVPVFAAVHHERLNGKGYPRGLAAQEIPLQGRIIALADIFEALTATDRPYRERKTLMEALCILASMKENGQIDPDLFDVFVSDNIYLRYARKYMCPEQIDEVDLSKITEYSPSLPK
jgi:HD-GYP domain-containing protein (c-di-GMP phosphodiesterase class II)